MTRNDIRASSHTIRIGLLLIDGFTILSYASFIEPLRAANSLAGATLYSWTHVSLGGKVAFASNGAQLVADSCVGGTIDCDMVFVFAGGDPASFRDERCFAWLRALARQGIHIGGVSGGPYLLARAGLLTHRRATIHWEHALSLQADFPDLTLEGGLFVIDGNRLTCAGGMAGLDLALWLIERDHGTALARRAGEWFIRGDQRDPDRSQRAGIADRYGTTNRRLLPMLAAMEAAIEEPLPRDVLAARAGVTLRQLERLCLAELGSSVTETYIRIRLVRAMELLRTTGLSITETAIASGFRSVEHFSRRFKAWSGVPPVRIRHAPNRSAPPSTGHPKLIDTPLGRLFARGGVRHHLAIAKLVESGPVRSPM